MDGGVMNETDNPTLAEAVKAAIEASPVLKASNVEIVKIRTAFDIENNRNRVRAEIVFDIR